VWLHRGRGLALEAAVAAELSSELPLEVHEAAEAEERFLVVIRVEGSEHSSEVVG
jgi:hypothetical protein